jgi:hypothetical protein
MRRCKIVTHDLVVAVAVLGLLDEIANFKAQIRCGVDTKRRAQLESAIGDRVGQINSFLDRREAA